MTDLDRRRTLWKAATLPVGLVLATATTEAAARPAVRDAMADRIDRLESKDAIGAVLLDYARGNDRVDETLLRSCFWPESRHRHGRFDGMSSDFVAFALKILKGVKFTAHHISNVSVEVDGDRAFSECYYLAHHRRDAAAGGGEEDAFFEGRYLDRFARRQGVWKIIERRGLSDFSTVVPAASPQSSWPVGQRSERHPDDDYYALRDAFRAH